MQTCPCNVYPLTPHFYIVKLGFTVVFIFLSFALKQRVWVLVSEAVLRCTHDLCFEQKYENSQKLSNENCHFYSREKSLYVAWVFFVMALTSHDCMHYENTPM